MNIAVKETVELKFLDNENTSIVKISKDKLYDKIEKLIIQEVSNIYQEYTPVEILEYKHAYLNQLINRFKELEQSITPIIILERFIEDYNEEYLFADKEIELLE